MKYALLALLSVFLIFNQSNAQVIPDFDFIDGKYHAKGQQSPYSGVIYQFYDNGARKAEIILLNGKIHGLYKEWFPNGSLKSTKDYDNGLRDGLFISYYKDGKSPLMKGHYVDGIPFGKWYHFSKKGDLLKQEEYNMEGQMTISRLY